MPIQGHRYDPSVYVPYAELDAHRVHDLDTLFQACDALEHFAFAATQRRIGRFIEASRRSGRPVSEDQLAAVRATNFQLGGVPSTVMNCTTPTVFHSTLIAPLSLRDLCGIIVRRGGLDASIALSAIALVWRVANRLFGGAPCLFTVHRLLVMSMYVMQKLQLDVAYSSATFSKISGLVKQELTRGELAVLEATNWSPSVAAPALLKIPGVTQSVVSSVPELTPQPRSTTPPLPRPTNDSTTSSLAGALPSASQASSLLGAMPSASQAPSRAASTFTAGSALSYARSQRQQVVGEHTAQQP